MVSITRTIGKQSRTHPEEYFEPCTYEDFFVWKLNGWDLPSSVTCIMRAENKDTGEITEHIYKNSKCATKRLINYMQDGMHMMLSCVITNLFTLLNWRKTMSLMTIDEFSEFAADYPEFADSVRTTSPEDDTFNEEWNSFVDSVTNPTMT